VGVFELNRQVAEALKVAREATRIKSGSAFARLLQDHVGGSPSVATYLRWEEGSQIIPAWGLVAASQVSGIRIDDLLGPAPRSADVLARLAALEGEVKRLRQERLGGQSQEPRTRC
jgi:hypothetical protein